MKEIVELSLPVRADLVILARLIAATVASRAGFDVEEIEDLRLAVDELCLSLIEHNGDGRLRLEFSMEGSLIEVSCTANSPQEVAPGYHSFVGLSERILDALVDEHGRQDKDGSECGWLRKRRAHQQA
jgi:hypothetical protein